MEVPINFKMSTHHTHPQGTTVEVVGLRSGSSGRNCEEHAVCGMVVEQDVVLRIRRVFVDTGDGRSVLALAAYWISDGIDRCRVGYLPKHLVKNSQEYDGRLIQVTELYQNHSSDTLRKKNDRNRGVCLCAMIDSPRRVITTTAKRNATISSDFNPFPKKAKQKKDTSSNNNNKKNAPTATATGTTNATNTNTNTTINTKKQTASKPKPVNGFDVDSSGDSSDESSPKRTTYSLGHLSNTLEAESSYTGVWNGSSSTDDNGSPG